MPTEREHELRRILYYNWMHSERLAMFELKGDDEAEFWMDTEMYREDATCRQRNQSATVHTTATQNGLTDDAYGRQTVENTGL
jgi:hypothetical protein